MTPPQPATISIVACFYNEELVVNGFFAELIPILDFQPDIRFEIVCVDDGSQDRTLEQLLGHCQTDQRIRVIELTRNFGKEAALTAGIDAAIGDALIPIDADLQDPPQLIPALIEQWRLGAEVVLARVRRHLLAAGREPVVEVEVVEDDVALVAVLNGQPDVDDAAVQGEDRDV